MKPSSFNKRNYMLDLALFSRIRLKESHIQR